MKKKYYIIFFTIFIILAFIIIFFIKKESYVIIKINNEEFSLDKNFNKVINLKTLNSDFETFIEIIPKNYKVKINKKLINSRKKISLGIIKIDKNNKIRFQIKKNGTNKWINITINTLPEKFIEYEFINEGIGNMDYYLTTYKLDVYKSEHYIYKLNNYGQVIFYRKVNNISYNFKKNNIGEKIRYTYLEKVTNDHTGMNVSTPTKLVVLDEKYNKLKEIYYKNNNQNTVVDNHDYIYLGDNHYIIATFEKEEVYDFPNLIGKNVNVWNSKIQEVKDEKIIWEFQSINNKKFFDYVDLDYREFANWKEDDFKSIPIDYMHFNSMVIDPSDNNLVCSFRNIDAIVKIDRKNGSVLWTLGGLGDEFGLADSYKFSSQHSISYLNDNSLLIYDNGFKNSNTRVLKIKLDENNKKIENCESYNLNHNCQYMGSVQALDESKDLYLVTYGSGDNEYAFEELNLTNLESFAKLKIKVGNLLYNVNKY